MDMANKALDFIMNAFTTVMGWFSSFFGSILPGATATDDKKSAFVKMGLILVIIVVAAKVFRINLNIGGGKGGKK